MGYRKAVQVSKARQLRLDAHVTSICVGVQYVCFVESDATLITSDHIETTLHEQEITCVELYSSNRCHDTMLCTVSRDLTLIWTIDRSMNLRKHMIGNDNVVETSAISFDASGTLVALAQGQVVNVLQISNGHSYSKLEGHLTKITNCMFHSEPHILITASEDRTFRVWDMSEHSVLYQSSVLAAAAILSIGLNLSNGNLCVGFSDGILKVFEAGEDFWFSEVATVDANRYLRKRGEETAAGGSSANIGRDIDDLPNWATTSESKKKFNPLNQSDDKASEETVADIACPILQIGFLNQQEGHDNQELPMRNRRGIFSEAEDTDLFRGSQWIVLGTSNHMLLLNTYSFEIRTLHDFQKPILESEHGVTEPEGGNSSQAKITGATIGPLVRLARSVRFREDPETSVLFCSVLSAFVPCITCFELTYIEIHEQLIGPHDDPASAIVSVFPSGPPTSESILCKDFKKAEVKSKGSHRGSKLDKPITFHSKVRSSGYGTTLPPIPLGGRSKLKKKPTKTKPKAKLNVDVEYPTNCGMLTYYQPRNALNADTLRVGPINFIEYSPDARSIAIAANDKGAYSLKLPFSKYRGEGSVFVGHNAPVQRSRWSHKNSILMTSSRDQTARVWHHDSEDPLITIEPLSRRCKSSGAAPRGPRSSSSHRRPSSSTTRGVGDLIDAQFYYMDKFLLLGCGKSLYVYHFHLEIGEAARQKPKDDIRKGYTARHSAKMVAIWEHPGVKQINSVACNNSFLSNLIISAGSNKSISIFDAAEGKVVRLMENTHSRAPHTVCLPSVSAYTSHAATSYDVLLSAAPDNTVHLWDLRMNHLGMRFGQHVNRVHQVGVAFSPCMRYVAVGSEDKNCYIYDIRAGRCLEKLGGHTDVVSCVAYNPLHPQLATSSYDGRIRFYVDDQDTS